MTGNDFVKEIHNAEMLLERFIPHYWGLGERNRFRIKINNVT